MTCSTLSAAVSQFEVFLQQFVNTLAAEGLLDDSYKLFRHENVSSHIKRSLKGLL